MRNTNPRRQTNNWLEKICDDERNEVKLSARDVYGVCWSIWKPKRPDIYAQCQHACLAAVDLRVLMPEQTKLLRVIKAREQPASCNLFIAWRYTSDLELAKAFWVVIPQSHTVILLNSKVLKEVEQLLSYSMSKPDLQFDSKQLREKWWSVFFAIGFPE